MKSTRTACKPHTYHGFLLPFSREDYHVYGYEYDTGHIDELVSEWGADKNMVVEKHIKFRRLIPIIWKQILLMAMVSAAIVVPIEYFNLKEFTIGITTPLILGTAIAIFLGFRTNSAYERWIHGSDLYDDLLWNVRSFGLMIYGIRSRQSNKTRKIKSDIIKCQNRLVLRAVAFVWFLGDQLKDIDPFSNEISVKLMNAADLKKLRSSHNPTLKLLFLQEADAATLIDAEVFSDTEIDHFRDLQKDMARIQSEADSLKLIPFPTHYSFFTTVFIWLLVILLSLSLPANENSGYYAIPLVVLVGWIFTMIEGIGKYMDNPWSNNRNVVPTHYFSQVLDTDIRAMVLGETDLPKPPAAVDGALY